MLTKEEIGKINKAVECAKENKVTPHQVERVKVIAQIIIEKKLPTDLAQSVILKEIINEKMDFDEIKNKFTPETLRLTKELLQIDKIINKNFGKIPNELLSSIIISIPKDFQPIIAKVIETGEALQRGWKNNDKDYSKKAEELWYPTSTKLGLTDYSWRIQDYSFKTLNPQEYQKILKLVNKDRKEREEIIKEITNEVRELLLGKIKAEVSGRPKTLKSIQNKLKKIPYKKMFDIYGIRIICEKEKECYEALGYIHSKYDIIPEAFDDYIANPKKDGYMSIHTAVKRGDLIIEVQLRTREQHYRIEAEKYWQYKKLLKDKEFEKDLSIERQLLEWQKTAGKELTERRLSGKKIFVFTPKNEAIPLPIGASVIDFAFAVHTEIGKKMVKAKVNEKFAPIESKLNNLDKVEIMTSDTPQIKKTWLNFVVSEKAKAKIKSEFKLAPIKKQAGSLEISSLKKIKLAACCHPLPGEDAIGVKTTKRKIIIHKKDCKNIAKTPKNKLIQINFDKGKGQTEIKIKATERPGLIAEILNEIEKAGITMKNTNFKSKKTSYLEAIITIEAGSAQKLDNLIEKINTIPGVQNAWR